MNRVEIQRTMNPFNCTLVFFAECNGSKIASEFYYTRKQAEAGATYPVKAIRIVRDRL